MVEVSKMADYIAHQVYENIPEYKGISDNIIDGTETVNVQRWKYEAQYQWVQENVPGGVGQEVVPLVSGTSTTVSNSSVWDTINTGNVIGLDALHSGNGSNLRSVKRMELIYKDIDFKFAVNPSDYTQKEPNRVNITQTKGGAWIDAWGAGIVEFNIKGITGVFGKKFTATKDTTLSKIVNTGLDVARVLSGDSGVDVGYQRWKELRDLFRSVYKSVQDGETVTDLIQFYNYTDNEYWYCYPSAAGIELYRSKSKPHVYQYTLNLLGLRRIGEPTVSVGVIGNPNKEQSTSNSVQIIDTSENTTDESATGVEAEGNGENPEGADSRDRAQTPTTDNNNPQTTDRTTSISGGNAYKTKAAALNTDADVTVITNTRTKSTEVIRNQSKEYADLMAPLVGGSEGLLIPTTAYNTAKDLAITSVGAVLHISGFDQSNVLQSKNTVELPKNRLVQEIVFVPQVSSETYTTWKLIREYSPEILVDNLVVPSSLTAKERIMKTIKTVDYYGSTLYEYTNQYRQKYYLTKTEVKYLKTVLIDAMTMYLHLYKIYNTYGQLSTPITLSDTENLIKNVESLILYLEFNSTDTNTFYLQNIKFELRQLESILHQVKSDIIEYL